MVDRYRVEVHAYAWMETHYHLVLRTPDANLSKAMQWLEMRNNWPRKALIRQSAMHCAMRCDAIGGAVFVSQIRELAPEFGFGRETAFHRATRARVSISEIIRAIEVIRGEEWESLCSRHGDPALALAMWLARRFTGLSLRAIGQALGGRDYAAVGMAVRRLDKRAQTDKTLKQQMRAACQMLEVKMSP